ncbi:MAG: hypothetical protein P8123_01180, partial [bacterium]
FPFDREDGGIYRLSPSGQMSVVRYNLKATGIAIDSDGDYVVSTASEHHGYNPVTGREYTWWDNAIVKMDREGKILKKTAFPNAVKLEKIVVNKDGNYVVIDAKTWSSSDVQRPQYDYDSLYLLSPEGKIMGEWHQEGISISDIKILADNTYCGSISEGDNYSKTLVGIPEIGALPKSITQYRVWWGSGITITGPIYFNPNGGQYTAGQNLNLSLAIDPCYKSYDLYLTVISPSWKKLSIKDNGTIVKGITPYACRLPRMMPLDQRIFSMTIPHGLPKGKYAVYACLVPTGKKADLLYAEYVRRCYVTVQ